MKWRIASVSDIHLGHAKTPTHDIIDNLYRAFPDTHATGELDIIFLAGDVFDKLLTLSFEMIDDIHLWVCYMLRLCYKYNIVLRVLEGTPSHDCKQSRVFVSINDGSKDKANVAYIDDLAIEYIEPLQMTVLYIPDELDIDTDTTWKRVQKLLAQKGLQHVDFAIMHGFFEHQVPDDPHSPTHKSDRYLSIVKHYIFIGHHHVMSQYKRILAQGSFDCVRHGEPNQKGHFRVDICDNDTANVTFVPTTNATQYDTIDCIGYTLEESLALIDQKVTSYRDHAHIRLQVARDSQLSASLKTLKLKYPQFHWTQKIVNTTLAVETPLEIKRRFSGMNICPDSITRLIEARLNELKVHPKHIAHAIALLDKVKDLS